MNVDVAGRAVRLTNPDRVLWPATGATKADLVRYHLEVAPLLLPHVAGHPVTLHRFPEGVGGPSFFQTRAPSHPDWVRAVRLRSPNDKVFDVVVVDDLPGLVWASNITAIELHPFLGTAEDFTTPTQLVVDLDPGPPAGLAACARVALVLHELLDDLGLVHGVKASGGKGLHVHVPSTGSGFDATAALARALAALLAQRLPDVVVRSISKAERAGRVYVDWGQNHAWRSTIAPWSVRGLTYPTVAAPLTWDEVLRAAETGDGAHLVVLAGDVPARLDRLGDPFAGLDGVVQQLPGATPGSGAA